MRFSEAFNIQRTAEDDWFDPHLTIDTRLFVDPILLLTSPHQEWVDAHEELINHFVHCYRLVAQATGENSLSARSARRLLTFPEPEEFCLGYTKSGTSGAGSGARYARQMADGIAVAIAQGLDRPEHVEEIGILNVGIGADRISDAACNVLKHRFIRYTQQVARRHGIELQQHEVQNARVHLQQSRWMPASVELPTNYATGEPILLIPEDLLNSLPTLNAEDWYGSLNSDVRDQLNLGVGQKVTKEMIVGLARRNTSNVRKWAEEQTSREDLFGYDYGRDPQGVVGWDREPAAFAAQHPLEGMRQPQNESQLVDLVDQMLNRFKHFVEQQRGWALLQNDDGSEKPETAAQLVFLGMAQHYLRLFNVEVDREVELGRGPVDFKISSGSHHRLLVEIKKEHNGKFWHGIDSQLPSYLESDDCQNGWFVAIQYRDSEAAVARMKSFPKRVKKCAERTGKNILYKAVDARRKKSASNIKD